MDFLPKSSQKVEVTIIDGPDAGTYSTYVDDVTQQGIVLVLPDKGGTLIALARNHQVHLAYAQSHARVSFDTNVLAVKAGLIATFVVAIPSQSAVQRVQLRDFVRQEANLPLTFRVRMIPNSDEELPTDLWHVSRTKDISGSGAQILCPAAYPSDTQLDIRLDVEGNVLELFGEVIRAGMQIHEKEWWVAIRFVGINERNRDIIIRYIFGVQRALRRKGLLGE